MYNSPFKNKNIDNINRVEPENTANTDTIKGLEGRTAAAKIGAKLAMSNPALQKQAQETMKDVKDVEGLLYDKATGGTSKGKSYAGGKGKRFSAYEQQLAERKKGFVGEDVTDESTGKTFRSLKKVRSQAKMGLTGEEGFSDSMDRPKPGTAKAKYTHAKDPYTGEDRMHYTTDIYKEYPKTILKKRPQPKKKK